MFRKLLTLLVIGPTLVFAQNALPPDEQRNVEQTMAEWLAHPMEFGVRPKRVSYLRSVTTKMAGKPTPVNVNIVEYEMPDGTYGRGFVNPVTWSFLGPIPYSKLTDEQLVTAYSGWLWIFSAMNQHRVQTEFEPATLSTLLTSLANEGISGIVVSGKYKVGTSEFFEFKGQRGTTGIKGAGSAGSKLILEATSPQASLPIVYSYLGMVMQGQI